jgi:hypothetical protein
MYRDGFIGDFPVNTLDAVPFSDYAVPLYMRPLDRTRMARTYPGKWVALKTDRKTVVGSGSTAKGALEVARKKGYESPIITRMPQEVRRFVGA